MRLTDQTSLVPVDGSLPSLVLAQDAFKEFITAKDDESLSKVQVAAKAQELYEEESGHHERSRHFAVLRLLAAAAIGVLSYDESSVIQGQTRLVAWRRLAAAYERGKLIDICSTLDVLSDTAVSKEITAQGWSSVAGESLGYYKVDFLPWGRAREIAVEKAIDFERLPRNTRIAKRTALQRRQQSLVMKAVFDRSHKKESEEVKSLTKLLETQAGKSHVVSRELVKAMSMLRRTLQATDIARLLAKQNAASYVGEIDSAYTLMRQAEEAMTSALGLQSNKPRVTGGHTRQRGKKWYVGWREKDAVGTSKQRWKGGFDTEAEAKEFYATEIAS